MSHSDMDLPADVPTGVLPGSPIPHVRLPEAEIEAIAARLREGLPLDDRYRALLFQRTREAELSYSSKETRGAILATTMGVPLQVHKRFGTGDREWTNKLVFGDNLQVLKTLLEQKDRGLLRSADGSRGVKLIYIDPPFATRREFRGKKGQIAYRDKVEGAEFVEYLRKRLVILHELLADDGSLYLHLDTNKVHYMKVVLDEIFGPQNFRSEIIWKRSSAHSDTKQGGRQHGRIHDTLLFYSKSADYRWNPLYTDYDEEYVASEYRHVADDGRRYKQTDLTAAKPGGDTSFLWPVKREKKKGAKWTPDLDGESKSPRPGWEYKSVPPYEGRYWGYSYENLVEFHIAGALHHRSTGMPRLVQYADEMPGVSLQDIWTDIVPVGSGNEREGYPTQKPRGLLDRVVKSSSNEGDLVLDCFAGSGTTLVSAAALGRRWVGIDCGKLAIYTAQRRLLSLAPSATFDVCYAGLYDNELLEQLPATDFSTFALDLFGCRPGRFEINGVPMAGKRKGDPVHVFPFDVIDAVLDEGYVESLHQRIGARVHQAVYVVVPDSRCDPGLFEDILRFESTSYFLLRVPYSVIEALHERAFRVIGQPAALDEVNDALDAYGFDFIQPPEAELEFTSEDGSVVVQVESFFRGGLDPDEAAGLEDAGRGDLAMVLVDPDFDGRAFRLHSHLFGKDLKTQGWRFSVQRAPEKQAMLVLIDTHGNELRRAIETEPSASASASVGVA